MTTRRRPHRGGVGGYEPRSVVETRAERVWALDAEGRSQREIARELGVSQAAVSKILRRVADRISVERRDDLERRRARALNREHHLYRMSLLLLEQSRRDQTRRRQRQITDANGRVLRAVIEAEVRERDGDPRFLEQAGRALERAATLDGFTHGPFVSTPDHDPGAVRERLASQLDRLAAAVHTASVGERPE
jgi:DNA-binding CsgD family transcriptional regulator